MNQQGISASSEEKHHSTFNMIDKSLDSKMSNCIFLFIATIQLEKIEQHSSTRLEPFEL